MQGTLKVECVISLNKVSIPDWVYGIFEGYETFRSDSRYIVDLPKDWEGFRDGTIVRLLETFNEGMYAGLAYLTTDSREIVTDFDGRSVDVFNETSEGKRCMKYVKKRLRIFKQLDEGEDTYRVLGYMLNLAFLDPIITVLDMYSVGRYSGLPSSAMFEKMSGERRV